jgi:hypothetical protein
MVLAERNVEMIAGTAEGILTDCLAPGIEWLTKVDTQRREKMPSPAGDWAWTSLESSSPSVLARRE